METGKAIQARIGGEIHRHELRGERIVLGRGEACDVVLLDPSISRLHAELRLDNGRLTLRDLGSSNGTRLNGEVVTEPVAIGLGDRITLAAVELELVEAETRPPPYDPELTLTDLAQSTGAEISWQDLQAWRQGRASHRDRLLRMMLEASELIQSNRAPEALFEPVLDLMERAFKADRMLLVRAVDPARPEIAASRFSDLVAGTGEVVLSRAVVRRVLDEKVALLVEDANATPDTVFSSVVLQGVVSALAAPVLDEDRVVGLLWADSRRPAMRYDEDDLKALTLLAGVCGHALTQARSLARDQELQRLETELRAARRILATILPTTLPEVPGWELCAHLDACHEVGGDLYQLRTLPDGRLLVVAGDVAGKGLGAALLVATILPVMDVVCENLCNPAAMVRGLNRHIHQVTDPAGYATLFVGVLDPVGGRLCYVNAGHNPPFLLDADGGLQALGPTGTPVGMFEDAEYGVAEAELAPGTSLVMYSDGISEAEACDGGAFYGEGRFAEILRTNARATAPELLAEALCDLTEFLDGREPADDITLVMVRRATAAAAADI